MEVDERALFAALMEGVPFSICKTDAHFFPEEYATAATQEERTVMKSGQASIAREEALVGSDGSPRWFSVSRIPMRNADGAVCGLLRIRAFQSNPGQRVTTRCVAVNGFHCSPR